MRDLPMFILMALSAAAIVLTIAFIAVPAIRAIVDAASAGPSACAAFSASDRAACIEESAE